MRRLLLLLLFLFGLNACDTPTNEERRGVTALVVPTAMTRFPPSIITTELVLTPTPQATEVTTDDVIDEDCTPNEAWPLYTIVSGDRIFNLAQQVNSTVDEIVQGNCLADPNQLQIGQQLYLPQLPPTLTPTPQTNLVVTSFSAQYPNIPLGGTISFSWSVEESTRVQIAWQTAVSDPEILLDHVSPQGSYSFRVPEWIGTDTLTFVLQAWDASGESLTTYLDVTISELENAGSVSFDETAVPAYSTALLRWDVPSADMIHVYWYPDQDGLWLQRELLTSIQGEAARSGTSIISLEDPRSYGEVPVEVEVADANGRLIAHHIIPLMVTCADTFLISDSSRPPATCPTPTQETEGAFQPFEKGFMVWQEDENIIHVFFADGRYTTYPDTWQEGDTFDLTPPDGLLAPVQGFAKVWQAHATVQDGLGWATETEQIYSFRQQFVDLREMDGALIGNLYIQIPETVVRINAPDYTIWTTP